MPCWADSLMSRWIRPPESPMPIGTRSRSRAGRGRQAGGRVEGVDVAEAEQLHVVGVGRGDVDAPPPEDDVGAGGLERRDPAGEGLGRGEVALVGERLDRLARAGAAPSTGQLVELGPARRRTPAAAGSSPRARPSGAGRSSRVTPCRPSGGTMWLPGGRWPPSMTSRMCGVGCALVGAEAGPVAEVGRQQAAEVVERGGRPGASRPDRVGLARALRVREPLDPVPVGEVLPRS